ncbi:hypothetical protein PIB30_089017, partial [Stylosanthes scabra]|nr:hypothetical protein [Stylosanthes scabra]
MLRVRPILGMNGTPVLLGAWSCNGSNAAFDILNGLGGNARSRSSCRTKKRSSYSVASGYKIAFQIFHFPVEPLPKQCCRKQLWAFVWDLQCPPKVKAFLWKALHDGLP